MASTRTLTSTALVALLGVLLSPAAASAASPKATKPPIQKSSVSCVAPSEGLEFGGAQISVTLRSNWLPKAEREEFFTLVPVDNRTGNDSGPRTSLDRAQRRTTVVIPADGSTLTPASTLEVRYRGETVQRIPVRGGCGILDPDPTPAPVIGAITVAGSTVTVEVTNPADYADDILVSLFPVGGNVAPTTFVHLAPGATGTVSFSDVTPGSYYVEAFGATEFGTSTSAPFAVG